MSEKEKAPTPDRGDEVAASAADLAAAALASTHVGDTLTDNVDPERNEELPEGAGDETDEEREEREKAEAKAEREKRIRIPKARLDEVLEKAKVREGQLLDQIRALQTKQPVQPVEDVTAKVEAEIEAMQEQYEDALIDGRKAEAKELRVKINARTNQLFEHKTAVRSEATRQETIEELQYNATLANIEGTHPELNPESAVFNSALTDEISSLMSALVKDGMPRVQALARATKYVIPTSRPVGAPATTASATADARAAAARAKSADAARRQPPSLSTIGADADKAGVMSGKTDVTTMSPTQFAKVSMEERRKLRGDDL